MKKIFKRTFLRNDGENLYIFGYDEHNETPITQIETSTNSSPHLRWNPARQEWVTYSDGRKNRTSFPPKEYCPLCPAGNLNFPTEIPFKDFEIAVFPNRWPSFNSNSQSIINDTTC